MKIEVLGVGCSRCHTLSKRVAEAAEALGVEHELEQVTDLNEILRRGIVLTPTLSFDGKVVLSGRTASVKELQNLLRESLATTSD